VKRDRYIQGFFSWGHAEARLALKEKFENIKKLTDLNKFLNNCFPNIL